METCIKITALELTLWVFPLIIFYFYCIIFVSKRFLALGSGLSCDLPEVTWIKLHWIDPLPWLTLDVGFVFALAGCYCLIRWDVVGLCGFTRGLWGWVEVHCLFALNCMGWNVVGWECLSLCVTLERIGWLVSLERAGLDGMWVVGQDCLDWERWMVEWS